MSQLSQLVEYFNYTQVDDKMFINKLAQSFFQMFWFENNLGTSVHSDKEWETSYFPSRAQSYLR